MRVEMIHNLRKTIKTKIEKMNKMSNEDLEEVKNEQMNNTVIEMEKCTRINNRITEAEEQVSDLEDRMVEITTAEQTKEKKRMKTNEDGRLWWSSGKECPS